GIDLDIEILRPRQAFQRMLDKKEFDVSELSLASYTALKGRGECPFVAVPGALSQNFPHSCIYVRRGAVVAGEDISRAPPRAGRIYRAFVQARDLAVGGLYDADALRVALPWLIDHVEEARRVFGADFWAYGLEPNRPTFEAIGRYVHEQGLSPRVVGADELFA